MTVNEYTNDSRDTTAEELIWAVGQALSGKKYLPIPSENN
jgi:hypothetical protein